MLKLVNPFAFPKQDGPSAKLILLLFVPIIRNTVLIRKRAAGSYATVDGWALIDIIATIACVLVLLKNTHCIPWKRIQNSAFFWWMGYYVFCAFSIFWCLAGSNVYYILYRAMTMGVMSLYVFFLISQFKNANSAFLHLLKYVFWIMLFDFLGQIRRGDLHTNSYSVSAAVIAVMVIALMHTKQISFRECKWYLISSCTCLLLGTCGASNVAFLCGLIALYSFHQSKISVFKALFIIIILCFFYFNFSDSVLSLLFPGKTIAGIQSATGRVKMWEFYLDMWKQRPWFGFGFAVGERSGHLFGYVYTLSAHNGFLSILLNTGIAGMIIWGTFYLQFIRDVFLSIRQKTIFTVPISVAILVLSINNLAIPTMGSNWGPIVTITLLVISFHINFIQYQVLECRQFGIFADNLLT